VSDFEKNMHTLEITPHGGKVGESLAGLHGIFGGQPVAAATAAI